MRGLRNGLKIRRSARPSRVPRLQGTRAVGPEALRISDVHTSVESGFRDRSCSATVVHIIFIHNPVIDCQTHLASPFSAELSTPENKAPIYRHDLQPPRRLRPPLSGTLLCLLNNNNRNSHLHPPATTHAPAKTRFRQRNLRDPPRRRAAPGDKPATREEVQQRVLGPGPRGRGLRV